MIGFYRTLGGTQSWEYYDLKTDVVILGDVAGYKYLLSLVEQATRLVSNERVSQSLLPNSMQMVITGAVEGKDEPKLRIIERPIVMNGRGNMEVVIMGGKAAYCKLQAILQDLIERPSNDVSHHVHIDDSDGFLLPRSISLNIRQPMEVWNPKKLENWTYLLDGKTANYFPAELDYMVKNPEPYFDFDEDLVRHYLMSTN